MYFSDGLKIYKKTLKESFKGRTTEVQHKARVRSRQQRVYKSFLQRIIYFIACTFHYFQLFERRAKVVKRKEAEMKIWEHVTPDMMSEEEEDPSGECFIRHQISW